MSNKYIVIVGTPSKSCGPVKRPPFLKIWLSLQPNFQKGGLDRTSTFRGGCWERGGDFFQGGVQLSHNKLKSEIFNDKKSL